MTTAASLLAYNPSDVKPGWIAFFVVMVLIVATFLLWRNMNKQLKRIRVPYRAELESDHRPVPGDRPGEDVTPDDEPGGDAGSDPAATER